MTFLTELSPEDALRLWGDVIAVLEDYPELWENYTKEELRTSLVEGRLQMWMLGTGEVGECLFLTQIYSTPKHKIFQVWLGVGTGLVHHWETIVTRFREAAREEECEQIEVITRRTALVHLLRGEGFRITDMTLTETVTPRVTH